MAVSGDQGLRANFTGVDCWVFDLDNTLYSAETTLWPQIEERINAQVASLFSCGSDEARRIQRGLYMRYGTTLRGLMVEHGVTPGPFLEAAHDIDYSVLEPAPALRQALLGLPGRRFVFTSGTAGHARNATAQLGIDDLFEAFFDIVAADYVPKPAPETYDAFTGHYGVDGGHAAMFEDIDRNLEVPKQLGMRTVLVVPQGATEDAPGHVDHVTDDLAAFLGKLG